MNENKNLTINEIFSIAVKNHQNNKLDVAQDLYNQVLKIDPNHANASNNLGTIFRKLKDYQKARDRFDKAIKINPDYANAHYNLGLLLHELEDKEKERECYEKAIEIDPNYVDAHNNLGVLLQDLKEYQKAKDCYEKAIQINPNYLIGLCNLGNNFAKMGEYQKAVPFYEKSLKIDPNNIDIHNNLGLIYSKLGEHSMALNCFDKAIKIDPNNQQLINNLTNLFEFIQIDSIIYKNTSYLKELFLFLFKNKNIYHKHIADNAVSLLFKISDYTQIYTILNSEPSLLNNKIIQKLLGEELLQLILQRSLFLSSILEKFFTKIRYEILSTLNNSNKDTLNKNFNFIISLAEQCWLNEFIYIESENEIKHINQLQEKIENEKKINELDIAILGCYIPLCTSKIISEKLLNYESSNILFNDLINVQIKEPLREKELTKSIASLGEINDSISKKVQEQYEEHPYPRWRYTNIVLADNFTTWLDSEINTNKVIYDNDFISPNVLIAGCGTGYHSISATKYKNSNILAVDLSLTSLAYAKRKTEEFGIKNVEYMHADLLQLKKLNKKFDIIESAGVLHHMKDPIAGLKVLTHMLEPHGFMKLGLYSELARKSVVKGRDFIKKNNFNNTTDDIKIFRQLLINKKEDLLLREIVRSTDFYSTSRVRDLLFHVQEHRFTIPQISKMLKDLDLEFLGFLYPNPSIKKKFCELFPKDESKTSLDNWHKFEEKNPNTFFNTYQFWVKKI